ncbi:MAG: hypothetical protein ACRCWQ_13920 [Bacilli bacterium]
MTEKMNAYKETWTQSTDEPGLIIRIFFIIFSFCTSLLLMIFFILIHPSNMVTAISLFIFLTVALMIAGIALQFLPLRLFLRMWARTAIVIGALNIVCVGYAWLLSSTIHSTQLETTPIDRIFYLFSPTDAGSILKHSAALTWDSSRTYTAKTSDSFTIFYEGKDDEAEANEYMKIYTEHIQSYRTFFDKTVPIRFRMYLVDREDDAKKLLSSSSGETWGIFDPTMHAISMPSTDLAQRLAYTDRFFSERKFTFLHEMFHVFENQFYSERNIALIDEGGSIPIWFNEGLANAYPYILTNKTYTDPISYDTEKLSNLQNNEDFSRVFDDGSDPYIISTYAILAIYEKYGSMDVFLKILESSRNIGFEKSLQLHTEWTEQTLYDYVLTHSN